MDDEFKKTMMRLNNLGVVQIESGRFEDARECFTLALHLMKTILDEEVSTRSSAAAAATTTTTTSPSNSPCFCVSVPLPSSSSSSSSTYALSPSARSSSPMDVLLRRKEEDQYLRSFSSSSPDYVFRSPIYFSASLEEEQNEMLPLAKLALSLLFNLALSHHDVALQSRGASQSFEAALFHYQLAYDVQIREGIELSTLHMLGLINNVSQLLNCMGDTEGSHLCFEYLLSSMMLHVDQSRGHIAPEVMGMLERFMENISCTILKATSTARAA
jgi:hypothetical protein